MRTLKEIDEDIAKLKKEREAVRDYMRDAELDEARGRFNGKWLVRHEHTSRLNINAATKIPGQYDLFHVVGVACVTQLDYEFQVDLVVKIREISAEERTFAVHPHAVPGTYVVDSGDFDRGFVDIVSPEMAMSILHENELKLKGMMYDAEKIAERIVVEGNDNA